MGAASPTTDGLLGGLWLVILVLLLMIRELHQPVADAVLAGFWWAIGWLTFILILLLAVTAIGRLLRVDGRLTGTVLAVLSILYFPVHAAMFLGVGGGPTRLFEFHSALQAVFYPAMTVLALVILLGPPIRQIRSRGSVG